MRLLHNISLCAILVLSVSSAFAQLAIGTSGAHPDAALDITSNSAGLLISRITSSARDSMQNPPWGLVIYNATLDSFQFFGDAGWINLALSGTDWLTTGNASTNSTNIFIGTRNNISLPIRTNNLNRFFITNDGSLGIGTNTPDASAVVEVVGSKGLKIPQAGTDIINPANGLMYYNTSTNTIRQFSNGGWSTSVGKTMTIRDNSQSILQQHSAQSSSNGRSQVIMRKGQGIPDAPTLVGTNEMLGTLKFEGYDGANFVTGARISGQTEGTVTAGVVPARIDIGVSDAAGNLPSNLSITSENNIGINKANPQSTLDINGTFGLSTSNNTNTSVIFVSSGTVTLPTPAPTTMRQVYIIRNTSTTNTIQIGSVIDFNSATPATFNLTPSVGAIMVHGDDAFSGVRRWVRIW